jgi:hypothetical protein
VPHTSAAARPTPSRLRIALPPSTSTAGFPGRRQAATARAGPQPPPGGLA